MPILQIRSFPKELYERLKNLATKERRSLAQQATVILEHGLQSPLEASTRRKELLNLMGKNRELHFPKGLANPVDLIRKDRGR